MIELERLFIHHTKGVTRLAKSTIDAIRAVEKETAEAEKTALNEALGLASQTKEDAAKLIRDAVAAANKAAAEALEDAKKKQEELVADQSKETEKAVRKLKEAGIGTYILFQETYHKDSYLKLHPTGPKHDYNYHTEAMDRAMEGGIDDVGKRPEGCSGISAGAGRG